MKSTKTNYVFAICLTAMGIALNIVGGQIALLLKLPIYFDCIGTVMVASLLGPIWGMVPNVLSGVIMGITMDIFSLYFAPVGIIIGFMAGITSKMYAKDAKIFSPKKLPKILLATLLISVPGTVVCAVINAALFGGVTSSGSSIIVQLLTNIGMDLTVSIFVVQFLTDFLDRFVAILLVRRILGILPQNLLKDTKLAKAE